MKVQNAVFILVLAIFISFISSYNTEEIFAADSQIQQSDKCEIYQNRRTKLREVLEPIDAIVVMKAFTDQQNGIQNINREFDYLTGASKYDDAEMIDGTIIVMSYRASFIVLKADDTKRFDVLKNWFIQHSGYANNQILMLDEDTTSFLKRYFSKESLVLLEQITVNDKQEFRDKELFEWTKGFVGQPMYPDSQKFNPGYLIEKIARFKTDDEITKLSKASEILNKALKTTAEFLPKTMPMPDGAIFIDNKLLDEIKSKGMDLMLGISVKPVFNKKNKKLEGYKIQRLPDDPTFSKMKIYVNDIIVSVNGKNPAFFAQLEQELRKLAEAGGLITVELIREQKNMKQIYYVAPTNTIGAVDVNIFKQIFKESAEYYGDCSDAKLQVLHLNKGEYEEVKDVLKPSDSLMLQASITIDNNEIICTRTINLCDDKHSIVEIELIISKAATKIKELFTQKKTFTAMKSIVFNEFGVTVDFKHTGLFASKIFPEEIIPAENCVYQIQFQLGSYNFTTDSLSLTRTSGDADKYNAEEVSIVRKTNETAYVKFAKAGISIVPALYESKSSNLKFMAASIKTLYYGAFMTMPFAEGDLILEVNSTRMLDLYLNGMLDDLIDVAVKPYVATVQHNEQIMVVISNANFFDDFKLDHLANLTEECFNYILPMIKEEKYQNRLPMSNQAGLTAGMTVDLLRSIGYKSLPGCESYYLRSAGDYERTDIAGFMANEKSQNRILLKVSIPYDFSHEKGSIASEHVNLFLGLGYGLSNLLHANEDIDVLVHFYSQAKQPLQINEQTREFLENYENIVAINFSIDEDSKAVKVDYNNEKLMKDVSANFKDQLELVGFKGLSVNHVQDFDKDSLINLDPKKVLQLRFVIPAQAEGNLKLLKSARFVSLIPSIINAKMNLIRKRNAVILSTRVKLQRLSSLVKPDEDELAKKLLEEIDEFIKHYPEEKEKFESTIKKLRDVIETAKAEREKAAEVAKQRTELLEEYKKTNVNDVDQCEKMLKKILVFITLNPDETEYFEAVQKELIEKIKSMKKLQTRENKDG